MNDPHLPGPARGAGGPPRPELDPGDATNLIEGKAVEVETTALPPARVEYVTPAETARLLRASLKREFPNARFSVRTCTYSGGASIDVRWTDGPATGAVGTVAGQYRGAGFDGSIDLKYGITHWLMPDGTISLRENDGSERSRGVDPHVKGVRPVGARAVRFGADYVHCERDISDAERVRMVAEVQRIGTEEPYGQWSLALGDRWQTFGSIEAAAAGLSDYLAGKTDVADPPPADRLDELLARRDERLLAPHEAGELRDLLDRDLEADSIPDPGHGDPSRARDEGSAVTGSQHEKNFAELAADAADHWQRSRSEYTPEMWAEDQRREAEALARGANPDCGEPRR
ncbi:MAG: hypothetical protein E6J41_10125 [Chloroflexi bacterium]|nr:MAG: hypothetical protein E6J41_10125 [Chloroflexota bacterium]